MLIALAGTSFADFKYSETTKITGGSMMGAMKFVGAFSKQARQATAPQTHTVAVKGNKLRDEHSDGAFKSSTSTEDVSLRSTQKPDLWRNDLRRDEGQHAAQASRDAGQDERRTGEASGQSECQRESHAEI
jgi:hypothetical protein